MVLETTIGNSNVDLWSYVTPVTNLYWVRNLVANRLSNNGTEWAQWFSLFNFATNPVPTNPVAPVIAIFMKDFYSIFVRQFKRANWKEIL